MHKQKEPGQIPDTVGEGDQDPEGMSNPFSVNNPWRVY